MKVKELVEKYKQNNRIDIAKTIEAVPYISIAIKKELAEQILDNCTEVVDGEVHIDSITKYLLFTISVIAVHTNLEFGIDAEDNEGAIADSVDAYDMLCETGLLVKIIDTFRDDYASCQEVLNMATTDRLQNNMTLEKKLFSLIDGIKDIVTNMADKIDFDALLGDTDIVDDENIAHILDLIKK